MRPHWTFTGDGVATAFRMPGRVSTAPSDYRVTIGGVRQMPGRAYTLSTDAEEIVFDEAPDAGTVGEIMMRGA